MKTVTATFGNTQVEYKQKLSPRGDGVFCVVNLDYDQVWEDGVTHKSRPSRNNAWKNTDGSFIYGLPATARFAVRSGSKDFISLFKELQLWMHELCRSRVPSMSDAQAKKEWQGLMWGGRMITDHAGSDTHADYVNGTNLDQDDMKLKPMVTGGAILKIKGEIRLFGVDCWIVEAMNPLTYFNYNPIEHWWLFFYPTISRREGIIRPDHALVEYLSIPFPQYKNNVILPVFAPTGKNENYIEKSRVRILDSNEPNPLPYRYSL